jgi:hypothetical protein
VAAVLVDLTKVAVVVLEVIVHQSLVNLRGAAHQRNPLFRLYPERLTQSLSVLVVLA